MGKKRVYIPPESTRKKLMSQLNGNGDNGNSEVEKNMKKKVDEFLNKDETKQKQESEDKTSTSEVSTPDITSEEEEMAPKLTKKGIENLANNTERVAAMMLSCGLKPFTVKNLKNIATGLKVEVPAEGSISFSFKEIWQTFGTATYNGIKGKKFLSFGY